MKLWGWIRDAFREAREHERQYQLAAEVFNGWKPDPEMLEKQRTCDHIYSIRRAGKLTRFDFCPLCYKQIRKKLEAIA